MKVALLRLTGSVSNVVYLKTDLGNETLALWSSSHSNCHWFERVLDLAVKSNSFFAHYS